MIVIEPVKLKYILKEDFLESYIVLKQVSLIELIHQKQEIYLVKFLKAVFDNNEKILEYIFKGTDGITDYIKEHKKLIEIVEKINELDYEALTSKENNENNQKALSVSDGMVLLTVYSGFSEEALLEFTFIHYKKCITEFHYKFQFNAIVNLLGNSYGGKDAFDIINKCNPLLVDRDGKTLKKNNNRLTIKDLEGMGIEIDNNAKLL